MINFKIAIVEDIDEDPEWPQGFTEHVVDGVTTSIWPAPPYDLIITRQSHDGTLLFTNHAVLALSMAAKKRGAIIGPVRIATSYDHPTHPMRQYEVLCIAVKP